MMNAEKGPRQIRLVTALVLFLVFLAGLATGAALVRFGRPPFPPPPPMPALRGIDLSEQQHPRVHAIREKYKPQLDAVVRDTFPRIRAVEEAMNREVRAELTPEQQRRFDENEAHRPPGPPGMPPPPPPP